MLACRGRIGIVVACLSLLVPAPFASARAASCAAEIRHLQNAIDDKGVRVGPLGPDLPQTRAAQLHRQPTRRSVRRAERKARREEPFAAARLFLAKARKFEARGDHRACRKEVARARRLARKGGL